MQTNTSFHEFTRLYALCTRSKYPYLPPECTSDASYHTTRMKMLPLSIVDFKCQELNYGISSFNDRKMLMLTPRIHIMLFACRKNWNREIFLYNKREKVKEAKGCENVCFCPAFIEIGIYFSVWVLFRRQQQHAVEHLGEKYKRMSDESRTFICQMITKCVRVWELWCGCKIHMKFTERCWINVE